MILLKGSLWALFQYDVSEEIRLDDVRHLLGAQPPGRGPEFRGPSPDYVRFARPPLTSQQTPVRLKSGTEWSCTAKLYEYGVLGIAMELPFESDWDGLIQHASRWIGSAELEQSAVDVAKSMTDRIRSALVKPSREWTSEDYYTVHLREAHDEHGRALLAAELIRDDGGRIVQVVRGESTELSAVERQEILQQWLSYYPTDFLVVAWMAAFVYDNAEGAAPVLQLLEYANTQLLEFRYYDKLLSGVLAHVHDGLDRRRGVLGRWRLAGEAERLNRIRLDVIDLTERIDNSIKFLSDMYYARAYRLAARTTRSPLKARALRNPGEFLGKEIKRLQTEDIGSYVEVMVMFVVLALLEWARFFLKWPPQPWLFSLMALLICCFSVIKITRIRRRVRILRQAEEGEKAVGQYLETLREKGYKVLHDIVAGSFNLDHVLIGPSGLYVIETKTISKPTRGQAMVEYDGEKVTVNGHTPDRDPVVQARALSRWLEELIRDSTGRAFKVRPVVVYPGWYVSDQPKGAEVWVLNPKALPAFLEHEKTNISSEDVHLVCYHLSRYVRGMVS